MKIAGCVIGINPKLNQAIHLATLSKLCKGINKEFYGKVYIIMNFISKLLICLLLTIPLSYANTSPLPDITKNDGLLLLKLDVESDLAIMTIRKLGRKSSVREIKLVSTNGKWLVKSLPQGEYQIVDVKVPYFNLPYIKSTEKNPSWKFIIKAGKLNYAGEIKVEKERTEDFVKIHKYFRPAYHLTQIQQDLSNYLSQYPLASGTGLRDDFVDGSIIEKGAKHD
jgi:hypothetical protein